MIKIFYPGCFFKTFIRIITYDTYFYYSLFVLFYYFHLFKLHIMFTTLYFYPVTYTLLILAQTNLL